MLKQDIVRHHLYALPEEKTASLTKTYPHLRPLPGKRQQVEKQWYYLSLKDRAQLGLCALVLIALLGLLTFIRSTQLERANMLQKVEQTLNTVQTDRSHVQQQVDELGRYDRINEIAKKFGLVDIEENLRKVDK